MEFDSAMDHFGRGAYRDALTNANAALESVLQVLTGKKGTAGELIPEAGRQGLIPGYLSAGVENFEKLMHVVPATRGQQSSAHGLADRPNHADEHLAQFILTTVAGLITFLAANRRRG